VIEHNPAALPEGAVFHGRYQIVRCIKAGGMGAVYECIHLTTRKRRALKVILPRIIAAPGMRERFELEARITAEIESEHIVETFDAGIDEATGAPFLVMELLRGDDLDHVLQTCGPFGADETVALLAQAALALDRTHAAGIVHRDLKPQNLFLTTRDDGAPRLKILDFGIAKVVADGAKPMENTEALGSPTYMSPEQATGDGAIGPAADLYTLGHIAYAMLAGQAYWLEEQRVLPMYTFIGRMIAGPVEPPSMRAERWRVTVPATFDAWFARATALAPGDRFDSASAQVAELARALGTAAPRQLLRAPPALEHRVTSATPVVPSTRVVAAPRPPPARGPRAALAVVGILVVAVGLVGLARAFGGTTGERTAVEAVPAAPRATAVETAPTAAPTVVAPAIAPPVDATAVPPVATAAPLARPAPALIVKSPVKPTATQGGARSNKGLDPSEIQ
jgi:serine/threonine protein kinase